MDFSALTNDQLLQLLRAACTEAASRGTAVEAAAHEIVIDAVEAAKIAREAVGKVDNAAVMAEKIRIAREAVAKAAPVSPSIDPAEQARIRQSALDKAAAAAQRQAEIDAAEAAMRKVERAREAEITRKAAEEQRRLWNKKRELALLVIAALPGVADDIPLSVHLWKNVGTRERRIYIQGGEEKRSRYGRSHDIDICYYVDGCNNHAPGSMTGAKNYDKTALLAACKKCLADWNSIKIDIRECAAYQETTNA